MKKNEVKRALQGLTVAGLATGVVLVESGCIGGMCKSCRSMKTEAAKSSSVIKVAGTDGAKQESSAPKDPLFCQRD